MKPLPILLAIGLLTFGFGCFAQLYMRIWVGCNVPNASRTQGAEATYRKLAKEHAAPRWPVTTNAICIPLGVVLLFGAFVWDAHVHPGGVRRSRTPGSEAP
jgi:hypothetical protein